MFDNSVPTCRCTCSQCAWDYAIRWGHEDLTTARERIRKLRNQVDKFVTAAAIIFFIAVAGALLTYVAGLGLDLIGWYNPFNEILWRAALVGIAVVSGLGAWVSSTVNDYLRKGETFLSENIERFEIAHQRIYELQQARRSA